MKLTSYLLAFAFVFLTPLTRAADERLLDLCVFQTKTESGAVEGRFELSKTNGTNAIRAKLILTKPEMMTIESDHVRAVTLNQTQALKLTQEDRLGKFVLETAKLSSSQVAGGVQYVSEYGDEAIRESDVTMIHFQAKNAKRLASGLEVGESFVLCK